MKNIEIRFCHECDTHREFNVTTESVTNELGEVIYTHTVCTCLYCSSAYEQEEVY